MISEASVLAKDTKHEDLWKLLDGKLLAAFSSDFTSLASLDRGRHIMLIPIRLLFKIYKCICITVSGDRASLQVSLLRPTRPLWSRAACSRSESPPLCLSEIKYSSHLLNVIRNLYMQSKVQIHLDMDVFVVNGIAFCFLNLFVTWAVYGNQLIWPILSHTLTHIYTQFNKFLNYPVCISTVRVKKI